MLSVSIRPPGEKQAKPGWASFGLSSKPWVKVKVVRSCNQANAAGRCSPMTCPLRGEFPGAVSHVTARGDGREMIFLEEADWRLLLDLREHAIERFGWRCLA